MASKKRAGFYKAYHDATNIGKSDVSVPYSTWKRWLQNGTVTVEQLHSMGINPRKFSYGLLFVVMCEVENHSM